MADDVFGFSGSDVSRIASTVRSNERNPPPTPRKSKAQDKTENDFFRVTLGDEDPGTPGSYQWTQLAEDGGDDSGGESNAIEMNSRTGLTGSVVWIIFNGFDDDGNEQYTFMAGVLPIGTAQYQVYQMTTNTTAGWDWVRAHT